MRSFAFLPLIFLAVAFYSCTNSYPKATEKSVEKVKMLEDKWMAALVDKDSATLAQILAPDFSLSGSSEEVETREQYLTTAAMPVRNLQQIVLANRSFKVYNKTVISTGTTRYVGKWKENSFNMPVRYTHVFVKNNKKWKVVAAHFSRIN